MFDRDISIFNTLHQELKAGLKLYWDTAAKVLDKSSIKVLKAGSDYYSVEKNFFSTMFLYSYFRAGITSSRRTFYAAVNQCLRGMVTGCDNILDDEYKMTLATDLPSGADKFRSIVDIMVSDRVLFSLLIGEFSLSFDKVTEASFESLRTLAKSGAQEASEEQGAGSIVEPDYILSDIHSLKTGVLFQSPWALPGLLEETDALDPLFCRNKEIIKNALFDIGMGCQIFDDMVDLSLDIKMNRHNYAAALIQHGRKKSETILLKEMLQNREKIQVSKDLLFKFPSAERTAAKKGYELLHQGLANLFAPEHQFMTDISMSLISKQIGADRFLQNIVDPGLSHVIFS